MSVVGNNRVGIPIVALHDAEGAVIEIETKNGELIRGLLFEAEDMMNLYIKNAVIVDNVTGVKRKSNQVYLQGSNIVMIVLPDMLKHAPMFKRIKHWRKHGGAPPEGVGQAVGQAAAIIRKATERRRGGFAGNVSGGPPGGGRGGNFAGGRGGMGQQGPMGGGRGGPAMGGFQQRGQGVGYNPGLGRGNVPYTGSAPNPGRGPPQPPPNYGGPPPGHYGPT